MIEIIENDAQKEYCMILDIKLRHYNGEVFEFGSLAKDKWQTLIYSRRKCGNYKTNSYWI